MGIQPVIVDRLMFLYYLVAGMLSERLLLRSTLDLGLPKVIAYRLKVSELFSELQLYISLSWHLNSSLETYVFVGSYSSCGDRCDEGKNGRC